MMDLPHQLQQKHNLEEIDESIISRKNIEEILFKSLTEPYQGEWDSQLQDYAIPPHLIGKNNIEAITSSLLTQAAGGDKQAISQVLDRTLGKPKQQVEAFTMTMTYTDVLDALADEEGLPKDMEYMHNDGDVIDISPTTVPDDELDELMEGL